MCSDRTGHNDHQVPCYIRATFPLTERDEASECQAIFPLCLHSSGDDTVSEYQAIYLLCLHSSGDDTASQ